MKIVMWVHVPHYREAVTAAIRDANGIELTIVDSFEELAAVIDGADALISAGASIYTPAFEQLIRDTPSIRWFQSVAAGNDNLEMLGIRPGIVVTGSGGHSGPIVAEHAIALLLAIAHAIPDWERARTAHVWKMPRTGTYKSLYRANVALIGLGHIGGEIARCLKGLDISVIGVSRSGKGGPHVDEAYSIGDLHTALGKADAVIVAAPLTEQTRGLIDAHAFAAMRKGAYFVNVARGGLVDQPALIAALQSGHLGGAAIDVTTPEPLPPEDPLWDAPNLIIVPHVGGSGSTLSAKRLGETVRRNLDAYMAGEPLHTVLPYGRP